MIVMCIRQKRNVCIFTLAAGELRYTGGYFEASGPALCAKLRSGAGRVRGHFECVLPESEVHELHSLVDAQRQAALMEQEKKKKQEADEEFA